MKTLLLLALTAVLAGAADPTSLEDRKARALALLGRMDFSAALAEAQSLNRASPDDVSGYQLMAAAQLELGDYDDAEKQLQWMLDLRIGKADSQGWLLVARFREVTGDLDGALDAVNLGYGRLAPGEERERLLLASYSARLLYVSGKLDLADQTIQRAGNSPEAPSSLMETLARVRLAQGKRQEAIGILRRLAGSYPHPRSLYLLAEATGTPADFAVFEASARAATASPDNANRELALYYATRGKQPSKALETARGEVLRRHDVLTLDALAMALFANRQAGEARSTMQRVLAVGTREPLILEHASLLGVKRP